MITLEEHSRLLFIGDPSARGVAAIVLGRAQHPMYKDSIKEMLLKEEHHLPLMMASSLVVEWGDDTLETLLATSKDERVLFALLEAARIAKRSVSDESILRLLDHESIFVRLAALKQAIVVGLAIDLASVLEALRADANDLMFIPIDHMPSPVFRHKWKFLRLLSRIQGIILSRKGR